MTVRGLGCPVRFILTAGQRGDCPQVYTLIEGLHAKVVMADAAYDADPLSREIADKGAIAVIPSNPSRARKYPIDKHLYAQRYLIECCFSRLKQFRRVATRYERQPERIHAARSIADVSAFVADDTGLAGLASFSNSEGFDVVFDATGSPRAMEQGFDHVAHGGRYVLVSVVKGAITLKDPDFHCKELTLLGSRNATAEDFDRVVTTIRDGSAPVDKLVTHRMDIARAVSDIPRWAIKKSGLIKAVVEIG